MKAIGWSGGLTKTTCIGIEVDVSEHADPLVRGSFDVEVSGLGSWGCSGATWSNRCASAFVSSRARLASPDPKPLILEDAEGGRFALRVVPPGPSNTLAGTMLADARALVPATEIDRDRLLDPIVLRDLLGPTLDEARVASRVGVGLPLAPSPIGSASPKRRHAPC